MNNNEELYEHIVRHGLVFSLITITVNIYNFQQWQGVQPVTLLRGREFQQNMDHLPESENIFCNMDIKREQMATENWCNAGHRGKPPQPLCSLMSCQNVIKLMSRLRSRKSTNWSSEFAKWPLV